MSISRCRKWCETISHWRSPTTLYVTLIAQDRLDLEDPDKIDKNVGFPGVLPTKVLEQQSVGQVIGHMGELAARVAGAIFNLPRSCGGRIPRTSRSPKCCR
ncbi:hypothetical protein ACIBI9_19140 [Nonomuraea sp. NPDC050451]|uniref:hypothetical protein n=1 Tax=Nonomuraea sp. NPDC050451 TaxID=3364364 RepID=UPI00379E99CA